MKTPESLASFGHVMADAGRVLANHWPQLVGLFLAGWTGRLAFLWLGIAVMPFSPTLSVLLVPLAPMCTLLSLVLMVRVTAESLPAFSLLFEETRPQERWRSDLAVAAQVLLPFLAVYASQGMLKADTRLYLVESNTDLYLRHSQWTRAAEYAEGPFLIGIIVLAIVARKLIAAFDLGKKSTAWAFAATFLEILWMITLTHALSSRLDEVTQWVTSRAVIAQVLDWWAGIRALLPTIPVIGTLWKLLTTFLDEAGDLVVVPVAWLALGATVFGTQLQKDENFGRFRPLADHDAVTQRLSKIPSPLKRYAAQTVEPVTTPVKDALNALGKIAAAGVVPMVLFCLIFAFASQLKVGIAMAFRHVVGTAEPWLWWSLAPYSDFLQAGLYFVVTMALLGAAVNAVVLGERRRAAAEDASAPEGA